MNLQTDEEKALIESAYREMLASCQKTLSTNDISQIHRAFNLANEAHKGVRRKSGEPYILHPIAVARIVSAEIGLGTKSIISSILHDVVEDTDYTIEDMERLFGSKIASIIDGLTKINADVFDANSSKQAENFRKIILTLADDIRVILIKLADRLHNMRTLSSMPIDKQMKIASETIYLYAPLAHRLGLYAIKSELEDLSLKYRYPEIYQDISEKLNATEKRRIQQINHFSLPIIQKLEENEIKFEISGRPKSIYSIWKKMQNKNVSFEEIYDLLAIRIIFEPYPHIPEKTQCWNIYSIITDIYKPKPDRLRDWISTPKANGYEALHCTVMGDQGQWVEVQIRSRRMDEIAERGFAAHWKYKEMDTSNQEHELDRWIKRIKETLENTQENALEFLDEFKLNLFASEIAAFTPKGEIRSLPKGATVLDFAYDIHTEIGDHAIGAKVNHKLVPLSHVLSGGDQVEVITAASHRPTPNMLEFVTTAKAKAKIKDALRADAKLQADSGREQFEKICRQHNVEPNRNDMLQELMATYSTATIDELHTLLGLNRISPDRVSRIVKKYSPNSGGFMRSIFGSNKNTAGKSKTSERSPYIAASCCSPLPGDEVVGVRSADNLIVVHKATCPECIRLMAQYGDRIVPIKWSGQEQLQYLTRVKIKGIDRMGMINDITGVITRQFTVNISKFHIENNDGVFVGYVELYIQDSRHLKALISNLQQIKGIDSVRRMDAPSD